MTALGLLACSCRSPPTATAAPTATAPAPAAVLPSSALATLQAIAADIEALAATCPQLADFHASKALRADDLSISYAFRTHRPTHHGGWTSGVPEPDPDGLWFYIDLHAPDSRSQIDTQPAVPTLDVLGRKLMMLVLEGSAGRPGCVAAIHASLVKRAAEADLCRDPRDEGAAAEATSLPIVMGQLLGGRPRVGRFTTEGWVQAAHHCNPCPPGASCKPCEEVVWLSADVGAYKDPLERDQNLVVHVPDATRFALRAHERVTVAACNVSTAQDAPLTTELRGSVALP